MSYFQETRKECNIESFYTTEQQIDAKSTDIVNIVKLFGAMGCYYHFCECMKISPHLSDDEIKRGQDRQELDQLT